MTDQLLFNHSVLVLAGPSGVGKTDAAFRLAQDLIASGSVAGVDIISADSRQVFKGLEVITGADIPHAATQSRVPGLQYPVWSVSEKIALHGVGILEWDEEWSVAAFQKFAQHVVMWSLKESRFPLLVGGTGLFLRWWNTVLPPVEPNTQLRSVVSAKTVAQLQQEIIEREPELLAQLNNSDKNNPRRLVRLLEKISTGFKTGLEDSVSQRKNLIEIKQQFVFLDAPLEVLQKRVEKRVAARWESGALQEVAKFTQWVKTTHGDRAHQLSTATGVCEVSDFLENTLTELQAKKLWATREKQYCKRQQTWFKKEKNTLRIDVTEQNWYTQLYDTIFQE